MRAYAVVIGIDRYDKHPEWNLTGASNDAVRFANWVTAFGGVKPADLTLLLSPLAGQKPATKFATGTPDWDTIASTLNEFESGQKKGSRFWFYYAGHGVAPAGEGPGAGPILVPSDTGKLDIYLGKKALGIETTRQLMQDVEPKEQFFFIDACRTVDLKGHKTLTRQIFWDPRELNDRKLATQVVFLSTTVGKKAKEIRGQGIFGSALVAALNGMGPELDEPPKPKPGRLSLYFSRLNAFVREAVKSALDEITDIDEDDRVDSVPYASIGRTIGDIEIAQFDVKKLPKLKISAVVQPADALPKARLQFVEYSKAKADDVPIADPPPIEPPLQPKHTFELRVGKHKVQVTAPGYKELTRPILVYEEKSFLLKLSESTAATRRTRARTGRLTAASPDRLTRLTIKDPAGETHAEGIGSITAHKLPPGPYVVRAELAGVATKEEQIVVAAGHNAVNLDIGNGNYLDPSENFGNIANAKFSSMLAYAAWAARWPVSHGFHRLRAEGVDPLKKLKKTGSALQVLVGDASNDAAFLRACRVQIAADDAGPFAERQGALEDLKMSALTKLHARQGARIAKAGAMRVRVEMPGFVATTFALTLLPRLVTVLVVSREANGSVEVQQYFNPIDPTKKIAAPFEKPQHDDVRVVEIGARALEHREPLADNEYQRLIGTKGSNPMLGLIAGYRTLNTKHAARFGKTPLRNMLAAFPKLPDVHVLAGLHDKKNRDEHFRRAMKTGTPIFAEGFWSLFDWLTQQALKENLAPPILRQELASGMVWTSFVDAPSGEKKDRVRIVASTGRTSLAATTDDRGVTTAAGSVGRIKSDRMMSTAFLLAPRIVIVPVHVARGFADVDAGGEWTLNTKPEIQFDLADKRTIRRVVGVLRTVRPGTRAKILSGSITNELLDDCWPVLLKLDKNAPVPPLTLASKACAVGERVAVIGFPVDLGDGPSSNFSHHFSAASGEKHVMSGVVTRAAGSTWTFDHNCFTARGTSGGPIVNHAGHVVGIHVVGQPTDEGFKHGTGVATTRFSMSMLLPPDLR